MSHTNTRHQNEDCPIDENGQATRLWHRSQPHDSALPQIAASTLVCRKKRIGYCLFFRLLPVRSLSCAIVAGMFHRTCLWVFATCLVGLVGCSGSGEADEDWWGDSGANKDGSAADGARNDALLPDGSKADTDAPLPDAHGNDDVGSDSVVTDVTTEDIVPDVVNDVVPDVVNDVVSDVVNDVVPDVPTDPPVNFSFVVFGDMQFATGSCTSGTSERLAVPKVVLQLDPKFFLQTGDLVDHSYEDGAYDRYRTCYKDLLEKIPLFPTSGNHDMAKGGIRKYRTFLERTLNTDNPAVYGANYSTDFKVIYKDDPTAYSEDPSAPANKDVLPSGFSYKTFYAFKHANAYFISFEQGTRYWTNTPKNWVEKHLKAAKDDPKIKHVFVYMHHPMYSTTMYETSDSECYGPVRKAYEELFRKYDVTMVFSGHAHLYDRFYVPDDNHHTRQIPGPATYPHDGKGIHYIVTGGGGGPLNGCGAEIQESSYNFAQGRRCAYHVTQVVVKDNTLKVNIVGVKGGESSASSEVWESFSIQ